MEKKTVVFLGGFSPATKAHLAIMHAAMEAVGAEKGVFLPEPLAAARKMAKAEERGDIMPDKLRVDLLKALIEEDPRLCVDCTALAGTEKGVSPRLWSGIRRKYTGERLFVIKDQRWPYILSKKAERNAVVSRFSFAVLQRPGENVEKAFERVEWLRENREAFVVFDLPQGLEDQLPGDVRAGLRAGDERVFKAVGEEGLKLLEEYGYVEYKRVSKFRGEYRFLSNFYPAKVVIDGLTYSSSEAAYQSLKCAAIEERAQFTALEPLEAKNLGAWVYPREDWDEVRLGEMARVLRAKFTQNPQLGRWLVSTAGSVLAEGNTWDDRFWGVNLYTGEGENHLGRLLMALREELLAEGVEPEAPQENPAKGD